jgi:hypothetical protein
MTVRDGGAQALTARCPAMKPRHFGAGAGLVDEHQALRIEVELAFEPCLASPQDVGTVLLRGMPGIFFTVILRRAKNLHSPATLERIPLSLGHSRMS